MAKSQEKTPAKPPSARIANAEPGGLPPSNGNLWRLVKPAGKPTAALAHNGKPLSAGANGIYHVLLGFPEDWTFSFRDVSDAVHDDDESVGVYLSELVAARLLLRAEAKITPGNGRGTIWVVLADPGLQYEPAVRVLDSMGYEVVHPKEQGSARAARLDDGDPNGEGDYSRAIRCLVGDRAKPLPVRPRGGGGGKRNPPPQAFDALIEMSGRHERREPTREELEKRICEGYSPFAIMVAYAAYLTAAEQKNVPQRYRKSIGKFLNPGTDGGLEAYTPLVKELLGSTKGGYEDLVHAFCGSSRSNVEIWGDYTKAASEYAKACTKGDPAIEQKEDFEGKTRRYEAELGKWIETFFRSKERRLPPHMIE